MTLHSDDILYCCVCYKRGAYEKCCHSHKRPERERQTFQRDVLGNQLTEGMSKPDRDNWECTPSSPPFITSPEETEDITFREETATPSEEVEVGLLKGQGAASFAETSGLKARASAEAKREDSHDKDICSNEKQIAIVDERSTGLESDFNGHSYPTRFENLSPG